MGKLQPFNIIFIIAFFINCSVKEPRSVSNERFLKDDVLLDTVQAATFRYFWDAAEPTSGMARERIHMDGVYPEDDKDVVTTGGSGFGIMAILVGIERGFISRNEGFERLNHIADYLAKAERFHGAWPHWIQGETGKVRPFGQRDNGGDLVETAFLVQGLLCVRQYFKDGNEEEKALAAKVDKLWREVEWSWYKKPDENVLLWHWSPEFHYELNHAIRGYDETMITYILGASSPTYPIDAVLYHQGWARNGGIKHNGEAYGYELELKHNGAEKLGGPLFWAHYSFLGLDPRHLKDQYAHYGRHNTNHTLINRQYCIENPKRFKGYGPESWGLTASYSINFYAGHKPGDDDLGVISPTAALSSFPYTPKESMVVMKNFYFNLGDRLWGKYGFYDAFSETENWFPQKYLAIDQGPIVVMLENHRTGLLWNLFMSCEEVKQGLEKLGFESPALKK
ncbi:MAG: beta-glucosidase [Bacteroidota bacterium]|nr:beta-glucosidase [Bacteroidota bacterium]